MPQFDYTISLGTLLMFGTVIATIWKIHVDNKALFDRALQEQAVMNHKINMMWEWFRKKYAFEDHS